MSVRKPQAGPVELAELNERILSQHRDEPHPELAPGALKPHLLVHAMVEKQLLLGDPAEVEVALEGLMASGLGRHEAIHRIGEVVMREAMAMLKEGRELDLDSYRHGLERLLAQATQPDG
jgi:hypothetical protein